jgi:undecaprenyl-diphosphatase
MSDLILAIILGIVEGLTEFLPVSSTAHQILAADLLGFRVAGWDAFVVMIQLGAILAIVVLYFTKLWNVLVTLPSDPRSRMFAAGIIIAFLPAAALGVLLHSQIKTLLFAPLPIAIALIVGGVIIIAVERNLPRVKYAESDTLPLSVCLKIGLLQCLAMIPGTSRSGATIIGALLMGVERRAAAEFSFFLAIPTMLGAFVYDLYKNWSVFTPDSAALIGAGSFAAFIAALLVVRWALGFIARHGFTPFAWYRIALGGVILAVLAVR